MTRTKRLGCFSALLAAAALTLHVSAQPTITSATRPSVVRGLYNWVHTTGNAEKAFPFYRDVFGIVLTSSPFASGASANAPPQRIRPVAEAGSDPLVWDLTDTRGARFRTAFMRAANTPFGLELSEFFDIARNTRAPNPWDPGASMLIFKVRDLDAVVAKLRDRAAPVVTLGAGPLETPLGRAIVVRDPDGYLVEIVQATPAEIAAAASSGAIIRTSIDLSVADTSAALGFYRDLLGFQVRETRSAATAEIPLYGLRAASLSQTRLVVPGTDIAVRLSEFRLPSDAAVAAQPFRWRIQDVGAPQMQLQVANLDGLLERTRAAGYRFLSVGARPIQRPFGRFVFVVDADGALVEFVEPMTDN